MVKKIILIYILSVLTVLAGCAYEIAGSDDSGGTEEIALLSHRFNQTPEVRLPTPEEAEEFPQLTNLPTLYITFEYLPSIRQLTRAHHYLPGSYTFIKGEEGGIFNEPFTIKRRGAWSYNHPKRPYTVELMRETSWGGLPPATKWIMIANWSDKSLLRNHAVLQLARWVTDDWSPNSFFADVFINGRYEGTYLITEPIEIHENRLALDISTEAVFEINAIFRCKSSRGCSDCISVIGGNQHIIYRRPGGALCSDARDSNLEWFRGFFAEMQPALEQGYEVYSQFIDVPSFVNWYIVNEFVKNFDSAFTASCFAFFKNGKLHMGPVWDFDTCLGNQDIGPPMNKLDPAGFWVNTSPWFSRLTRDETFSRLVNERWTELRQTGVFDDFLQMIDDKAAHIAESARLNFERWSCALEFTGLRGTRSRFPSLFTHEEEVEHLRNWAMLRIEWLDTQWYIG